MAFQILRKAQPIDQPAMDHLILALPSRRREGQFLDIADKAFERLPEVGRTEIIEARLHASGVQRLGRLVKGDAGHSILSLDKFVLGRRYCVVVSRRARRSVHSRLPKSLDSEIVGIFTPASSTK